MCFSFINSKLRQRQKNRYQGEITTLVEPREARFEIVAVHGLAANPRFTWGKNPRGKIQTVDLLENILKKDFEEARILSFTHNSDWLFDAPIQSAYVIGQILLDQLIKARQNRTKLPIIFIGHSFGGIIIKHALCESKPKQDISDNTRGIIFLGTPHQGTAISHWGALLASLTRFLGSDNTLLLSLKRDDPNLSDLETRFRRWIYKRPREVKVECFYELRPTLLFGKLSIGLVVSRNSATGMAIGAQQMNTNHTGMTKFCGPEDKQYKPLKDTIHKLIPSDEEYAYIRENIYTEDKLKIERLSKQTLAIDQCYINLAIVTRIKDTQLEKDNPPFSRSSRLKIETPAKERQVELSALFDSRGGSTRDPRRILIRGNAGIGKTTLCKKIVHDFTHGIIWRGLFDRILWVQLRKLKKLKPNGSLYKMFLHIYFSDHPSAVHAVSLGEFMRDEEYRSRSIFILDGLDEVVDLFSESQLLVDLLKMPSVIITTRPHVIIPSEVQEIDLEMETIGFYPDQVQCYIEKVVGNAAKAREIQLFLQKHRVLQSLVRIPIQLDALCLIWAKGFENDPVPETMTGVYEAICHYLWRKDIGHLDIIESQKASRLYSTEVKDHAKPEMEFVEFLAFSGLYDNTFEFDAKYRQRINDILVDRRKDSVVPFNELPGNLSFLRTSDTSKDVADQSYHFLHLTFQEFFAAKYFVKQWESNADLEFANINSQKGGSSNITAKAFLQENKYNTRYEFVWRFTAGLLHGEGLAEFFDEIEDRSPDHLGPVHQRLVMHCLSEVNASENLRIRSDLEKRLSRWLLFECDLTRRPLLAKENEFPDTALREALREGSYSQKFRILRSLDHPARYLSGAIVTDLEGLLKSEYYGVRYTIFGILKNQSNLPGSTLDYLLMLLKKPQQERTPKLNNQLVMIAEAIGSQSDLPKEIIAKLVELVRGNDAAVRISAAAALKYRSDLGDENIKSLIVLLEVMGTSQGIPEDDSNRERVRDDITKAVTKISNFPLEALEVLEKLLESTDNSARKNAILILARKPNLSEKTIAAFIKISQEYYTATAKVAFQALMKHTNLPSNAIEALVRLLQTTPCHRPLNAASILAHQSNLSLETKAALKVLTGDSNARIRYSAAYALKEESSLSQQTVEALLQGLKNDNHLDCVIDALSKQSNTSEQTFTALVALLKNADVKISKNASNVLQKQPNLSESARETLVELLEDGDSNLRDHAAQVLRIQSSLSQKTIENLLLLLKNKNVETRAAALESLGTQTLRNQSQLSKEIATTLAGMLCDSTWSVQHDIIAEALSQVSNLPKEVIAVLTQLLAQPSEEENALYQQGVVLALSGQQNLPEETIEILMTLLQSRDFEVLDMVSDILINQTTLSDKHSAAIMSLYKHSNAKYTTIRIGDIIKGRSDWSDNIALELPELLVLDDDDEDDYGSEGTMAAETLGKMQSKLSTKVATRCVELLQHADNEVRYKVAWAIGGEPKLVAKIVEALGLSSESKASAGDTTSSASTSQAMKALYGAFLFCGFTEQFWFQVNKDSTLTINRPDGSWTIHLNDPLSELKEWRQFWNVPDYKIPLSPEEPEPTLEDV
ncbi:armadillo-type protein [Xylaria scruposa]|nr:armadillo-type protein [Xylaria scruposa]